MQVKNKKSVESEMVMQLEFFSEEILVEIRFLKNISNINLLVNDFCFLKKNHTIKINLWIAIVLKNAELCEIIKPKWLSSKWLKKKIYLEKKFHILQDIPYNYVEMASIFHKRIDKTLKYPDLTINLVEKLYSIRFHKIWTGLISLTDNIDVIKLDKISSVELYSIKTIILNLLNIFASFI
nr:DNA replication complex gins protein psf2 [Cryptomonas sp.]